MMYRVIWEIEIEADSPREAAEIARKMQLDPTSTATVFDIHGEDCTCLDRACETGAAETVDLDEEAS